VRGPVEMEGGTTFHFVTDGIESALDQARKAAHGHDVMLWGGAQVANQDLAAGLLDELELPGRPYEIPERHRRAVRLMTPADTFPYSTSLDPDQIDHTEPYQHRPDGRPARAGQSRIGNYGPMTTPHHRLKTFGRWTIKQPFPGIYLWRDPHGALYLVDHTGTRPLPRDERRVGRMTAWVRSSVGTRT
ncbi:MAG TPA: hypothetical protein VFI40_13570, partial [Nocardioides sp.]|nr:hypothetical protein [Nocardioides sp.]